MATLAADSQRVFESGIPPLINEVGVIASDIIFLGAAVGESSATGTARPLVAGDNFLGFAEAKADNSAGAASDINVRVRQQGVITCDVVGVTAITDLGDDVYMSDDNVFTLTSTSNTKIGKLIRYNGSGTSCQVFFQSLLVQSV
tara:strand:- start:141 stop:572 length:432 start_codon:yes stop_codon:yes gene_type:complete